MLPIRVREGSTVSRRPAGATGRAGEDRERAFRQFVCPRTI